MSRALWRRHGRRGVSRRGLIGGDEPWNLNIHYDRRLAELAARGDRVLDVGCGDGFLSAQLAERGCDVVAVDIDRDVLARAAERWPTRHVRWLHSDIMDDSFEDEQFDVVVSNAALHHLHDTAAALRRLRDLVAPGGVLGIVGFARNGILDWPRSMIGAVGIYALIRVRGKWEHTAPIHWPPPLTYGQLRTVAHHVLPGSVFRKLWLGRYSLTWSRPAG